MTLVLVGKELCFVVIIQNLVLGDIMRVIFYVRRIGLYLYKFRIYGTMSYIF